MGLRDVGGRRTARRIAVVGVAAGVVALGAVVVPSMASAEVGQNGPVAVSTVGQPTDDGDRKTGDLKPEDDEPEDDEPGDDEPGDDEPGDDDTPAGIAPGAQFVEEAGNRHCTANFVHTAGDRTFIGSAAHCHARTPGAATDPDGCDTVDNEWLPLGTEILVRGFDGVVHTYLGGTGRAFGVLSYLFVQDGQIFNGVTDVANALEFAVADSDDLDGISVVDGPEPFSPTNVLMDALPDVDQDSNPLSALTDLLSPLGG